MEHMNEKYIMLAGILLVLLATVVSYMISGRIMENKEL